VTKTAWHFAKKEKKKKKKTKKKKYLKNSEVLQQFSGSIYGGRGIAQGRKRFSIKLTVNTLFTALPSSSAYKRNV
jgi:hypothetical protein